MLNIDRLGGDWLHGEVERLTEELTHLSPSAYNEQTRYLPNSVTSKPGYIRYAVNPYMREIVDCFDVNSPVREVNVKKGVQITYSTLLESGVLYYADYIGTLPIMYMTADKELALARIENNFIPMFNHSGKADIIRSSDTGNTRKTGKTKDHIQFAKGAYLVPFGARNADKMRSFSIAVLLKDEVDAWPDIVGKDGDPDALSDARTDGYTEVCKIFRGSTPLQAGTSKIQRGFKQGDQRIYRVLCRACGFPQALRWNVTPDTKLGRFMWETDHGTLVLESVRYVCADCGHAHHEHDKTRLFSEEHGAHWHPTARPANPFIRSYHIPALYSPVGMRPWWKNVAQYLEAYDIEARQVKDYGKYQVFYNNVLAEPFSVKGSRVRFSSASAHRKPVFRLGEIPNTYAQKYCGSRVLLVTCTVDVHKRFLAVAVFGWTLDARCFVIEYRSIERAGEDDDCSETTSPVWGKLQSLIEEAVYTADDGYKYGIALTLIDANYASPTVCAFCASYESGVYPIYGRERPAKAQTIKEFAEFTNQQGLRGYRILVDHYKDRLAPVLRREWTEDAGAQGAYHFNAPIDLSDASIKELTAERRVEKIDANGNTSYVWHRPGNARNELWDCLVYGHASVEILAWAVCIQHFELETIDWPQFWEYIEREQLYFTPPKNSKE
ncbi:phage terminase large subunit family protein [bacterium]|nr:phage terminase large subunit family protein [bacterium]